MRLGLAYEMLNFAGDVVNFAVSEPRRESPQLPIRLAKAAQAQSKRPLSLNADSRHSYRAELQRIAQLGER